MQKITHQLIKNALEYNADTGVFTWKNPTGYRVKAGDVAGTRCTIGYWQIRVCGKIARAHQWAWFWVYGEWPSQQIDHINGDRTDNRIANLRLVTHSQNMTNSKFRSHNTSGVRGVWRDKSTGKWVAEIAYNGKKTNLGRFDAIEDAKKARDAAASRIHGRYAPIFLPPNG